jgi:hypothetical protein
MIEPPRRFVAIVVLLGALLSSRASSGAPAAPPPVDLTGTVWHTEGSIHASVRGRTMSAATWLDVEFLPGRRFTATDSEGLQLAGSYEPRGARGLRLAGACDQDVIDVLEAELADQLQIATGSAWDVETLSQSLRAVTNGDMSRLRIRVAFKFRVEAPLLGRVMKVREWAVTRGLR